MKVEDPIRIRKSLKSGYFVQGIYHLWDKHPDIASYTANDKCPA